MTKRTSSKIPPYWLLGPLFSLAVLLSACAGTAQVPTAPAVAQATAAPSATPTVTPTASPAATATPSPTATSQPTSTPTTTPTATTPPTATPTPDPYFEFTVDGLAGRTYGARGPWDEPPPDEALQRISPINYLDRITAAVSIHHGDLDDQVPLAWSVDLCERLRALQKNVECFTYPGQPHTFVGDGNQLFIQRVREFFDRELK